MLPHSELATALETGDLVQAKELLAAHPEMLNSVEWTPPPLHCAVLADQLEIAEQLLEMGADIELRDPDRGTTPLRYAVVYCNIPMIEMLMEKGANVGPIEEEGTTALELALAGADGAFDEYDDLPAKGEFLKVVELLSR